MQKELRIEARDILLKRIEDAINMKRNIEMYWNCD